MKYVLTTMLLAAALTAYAQSPAPGQPNPTDGFMRQFDRDNNEQVTLEEFKAPQVKATEQEFKQMDKNGDGQITLDEIQAPQVTAIEQQFKYMDKNGDGSVDRNEVDALVQERQRMQPKPQQGGAYRR